MTDISKITTGYNENGVFESLMRSVNGHIKSQFDADRIRQVDFGSVYLGSIQATLQQSIQYALQEEINAANIDLIKAQTDKQLADTAYTQAQTTLTEKQIELANANIQQVQLNNQLLQIQIANATKEGQQIDANIALTQQNTTNAQKQATILDKQATELDSRTDLLDQKVITEKAQTLDEVDGTPVAGIVGQQRKLYLAQTDGFSRDAEQKAAKIYQDFYTVLLSNDPGLAASLPTSLNTDSLDDIFNVLKAGVAA